MSNEIESIGFVKYEGKRLETGSFDARKSAKALLGLDEALRHFMAAQSPELRDMDFEIPVRIEKGSWIASIPSDVGTLIPLGLGIVATAYLANAAKKWQKEILTASDSRTLFGFHCKPSNGLQESESILVICFNVALRM